MRLNIRVVADKADTIADALEKFARQIRARTIDSNGYNQEAGTVVDHEFTACDDVHADDRQEPVIKPFGESPEG